jgi:hypothetical protein
MDTGLYFVLVLTNTTFVHSFNNQDMECFFLPIPQSTLCAFPIQAFCHCGLYLLSLEFHALELS